MSFDNKKIPILEKSYNKYTNSDFTYGNEDSDNLNPKREISLDVKINEIVGKLQTITDDIIRKKILKNPEVFTSKASLGGSEQLPNGLSPAQQAAIANSGGVGNGLVFPIINNSTDTIPIENLLQEIIGTLPPIGDYADDLDHPVVLDCMQILEDLKNRNAGNEEIEEMVEEAENNLYGNTGRNMTMSMTGGGMDGSGSVGGEGGTGGGEDENEDEDNDNDADVLACVAIELKWLKIILIIVKILKIIQLIITLVLSILMPVIEIVRLAIGAWLNPPNIAKIAQIIVQLVISIVLMLIGMVLQLIWNLLNFDCISNMTQSIIDQIGKAMNAFASISSAFNANAVNLLQATKELTDPIKDLEKNLSKADENWAKFKNQMKDAINPNTWASTMASTAKKIGSSVLDGTLSNPNVNNAMGLATNVMDAYKSTIETATNSVKDLVEAKEALDEANKAGKEASMAITSFRGISVKTE